MDTQFLITIPIYAKVFATVWAAYFIGKHLEKQMDWFWFVHKNQDIPFWILLVVEFVVCTLFTLYFTEALF